MFRFAVYGSSLLFLLTFFLISQSVFATEKTGDKTMTGTGVLHQEPFFFLDKKNSAGYKYDFRLNDVSESQRDDGLPSLFSAPVPIWVKAGDNQLEIRFSPKVKGMGFKNADIYMALTVISSIGEIKDSNVQTIADIRYIGSSDKTGDELKKSSPTGKIKSWDHFKPGTKARNSDLIDGDVTVSPIKITLSEDGEELILSRTITLPSNIDLPRWAWLDSDIIPDNEATKKALINEYMIIWNALKREQIKPILPYFRERNYEFGLRGTVSFDDMKNRLREAFKEDLEDNTKVLWEYKPEDLRLHVFGGGRLAKITDLRGNKFIAFVNKKHGNVSFYDLIYRKSGDQWIITR